MELMHPYGPSPKRGMMIYEANSLKDYLSDRSKRLSESRSLGADRGIIACFPGDYSLKIISNLFSRAGISKTPESGLAETSRAIRNILPWMPERGTLAERLTGENIVVGVIPMVFPEYNFKSGDIIPVTHPLISYMGNEGSLFSGGLLIGFDNGRDKDFGDLLKPILPGFQPVG